ncbi:NAD(P)-dependent oxidoreductase [Streptomyces sp. NPDC050560]|uniref:NAD(P)-dependent oxidoreductase n=1 Tax=Streptomyces sp. NPDC050560 TaxID=3365630 RepID=UPI0037AA665B
MKLTVFGATGGVGGEIVRQALDAGHQVTAVVRDPARLTVSGDALDVVRTGLSEGAEDQERMRAAVAGREAVLSGLGARARKEAGVAERVTRALLSAMRAEGVRRLVVVSAAPVGPDPAGSPLLDRVARAGISALLRDIYTDLRRMEGLLEESGTEWTSVRPPRLVDRPLTGSYRREIGVNPRSGRTISRADVAHAMLASLTDPATVRQGVGVAY